MASAHKDSNPNKGGKGGGMKNNDGRQGGSGWNDDKSRAKSSFNDKSVGVMPNEGNKEGLGKKGVIAKVVGP